MTTVLGPGRNRLYAVLLSLVWHAILGCDGTDENFSPRSAPVEPIRIVSLSVPASRFIVALGAGDRIIAVDEASALLPELAGLPVVELRDAQAMGPDLILVPDLSTIELNPAFSSVADVARFTEFAPHDLEEAAALTRGLGAQLGGVAAATRLERRFSRPVALVAGRADSIERPRVVAVVELEPLTLAGGHSFETDLIEVGGGNSVTHGGEETRIPITPEQLDDLAPELVIVATREVASPLVRQRARSIIPERYPIEFFRFDRDVFWLESPEVDAERMRVLISSFR